MDINSFKVVDKYDVNDKDIQRIDTQNGIHVIISIGATYERRSVRLVRMSEPTVVCDPRTLLSPRRMAHMNNQVYRGNFMGPESFYLPLASNRMHFLYYICKYAGVPDEPDVDAYPHAILDTFVVSNVEEWEHLRNWMWQQARDSGSDLSSIAWIDRLTNTKPFPLVVRFFFDDDGDWDIDFNHLTKEMMLDIARQIRRLI
jgi:hypothetical protein